MVKLKLGQLEDDRPVRLTVTLTATNYRDLQAYAALIGADSGKPAPLPAQLIPLMIEKFMATDRGFVRLKRGERH